MDLDNKIVSLWERLFKYYENIISKKCKGASEEKILEVEKEFGVKLPKAFADSFRICDERYIFNTPGKRGWLGESDLYSLETCYDWNNLIDINKLYRTLHVDWKDEWIAFYDYGTWFIAVLDTVTGKVYCFDNETGERIIWKNSYEEWLEMAVDEVLKYGKLRLEPIEELMGIY